MSVMRGVGLDALQCVAPCCDVGRHLLAASGLWHHPVPPVPGQHHGLLLSLQWVCVLINSSVPPAAWLPGTFLHPWVLPRLTSFAQVLGSIMDLVL